jgi:DNA-binding IclR family transcriptional regulator
MFSAVPGSHIEFTGECTASAEQIAQSLFSVPVVALLEHAGYVERNRDTGKYQLGPRMFRRLATQAPELDLRELARPILRNLVEVSSETAQMVEREPECFTVIEVVDSSRSIRAHTRVGHRSVPHSSAMGRASRHGLPQS